MAPIATASMDSSASTQQKQDKVQGNMSNKGEAVPRATKPDAAAFHASRESLQKQINEVKAKLDKVRDQIKVSEGGGSANDRRRELKAELAQTRSKLDESRGLQDTIAKKVKELQTNKSKCSYRTVAELDAQIQVLNAAIESGTMRVVEEKKALQEISKCKEQRKPLEGLGALQSEIDTLRAQMDTYKVHSDRQNAIKAELDKLNTENEQAYQSRRELFDQRNALSSTLDDLWTKKKTESDEFRQAGDAFQAQVREDRQRRADKAKLEKAEEERVQQKAIIEKLREDASHPAYSSEMEDCQSLRDYFAKASGGDAAVPKLTTDAKTEAPNRRAVDETTFAKDTTILKPKDQRDDDAWVTGPARTKKNNKTQQKKSNAGLHLPMSILQGLMSLSIPPPMSAADLPQTIENLNKKHAWFAANSEKKTAEIKAQAEAEIARLEGLSKASSEPETAQAVVEPTLDN